jgi:predicted dehydrogenase
MLRWFTGSDIATVYSVGMGVYSSIGDGEDNAIGALTFKSGAFGTIMEGTSDPGGSDRDCRIVGTKKMIEIGEEVRLGKGDWTTVDCPPVGDHTREFVDSILEGRTPSCDGQDGRASLEASLAIIRSEETGEAVHLPFE